MNTKDFLSEETCWYDDVYYDHIDVVIDQDMLDEWEAEEYE